MIGYPVLREVVGADLLTPVAAADLNLPPVSLLLYVLLELELEQALFQDLGGSLFVLVLDALLLDKHGEAGGDVSSPAGTVGLVDMLASCALGSCKFVPNVFVVDYEVEGDVRHHHDTHGGRVYSPFAFSLGDSNHLMHP